MARIGTMFVFVGCLAGWGQSAWADTSCTGWIAVTSWPVNQAAIELDGKPVGNTTPATLKEISCGRHVLQVRKPLYLERKLEVIVQHDEVARVRARLTPDFGSIRVRATAAPGTTVLLDGDEVGSAPVTLYRIASGGHTVRVTRKHHRPFETRIFVPRGGQAEVDAVLEPRFGRLMVDTVPYAGKVALNGKLLGKAPLSLEKVPEGSHVLTVRAEGRHELVRRIRIQHDRTTVCEMNVLQPRKSFYRFAKTSRAVKAETGEAGD